MEIFSKNIEREKRLKERWKRKTLNKSDGKLDKPIGHIWARMKKEDHECIDNMIEAILKELKKSGQFTNYTKGDMDFAIWDFILRLSIQTPSHRSAIGYQTQ